MTSSPTAEDRINAREPLPARTLNEVRYYLMVVPCPLCGKGPRELTTEREDEQIGRPIRLEWVCSHCHRTQSLAVQLQQDSGADDDPECINPTDQPSRIIDLAQWLSLFYLMVESAARDEAKPAVRRKGYRAMLCLLEALKFYEDDELPPERAFFTEATAAVFREHPERFAKQRLRDLKEKLPAADTMRRRLVREEGGRQRRWWAFWRR